MEAPGQQKSNTENDRIHFGNHSFSKRDLNTSIQQPASQHTQRHLEKQNATSKTQRANNQGASGMGEALRY